jgi:hypothetical protein
MTETRKIKKASKKKSIPNRLVGYFEEFRVRSSDWLILTLAILGIECLLLLGNSNAWGALANISSIESLFYSPPFPAFLALAFCTTFICKAIMRKKISHYAIVVAILLSIIGILFLFGLTPSGQRCSGLFGVMEDCSETYRFQMYVLFLNPISLVIASLLAFTATFALIVQKNADVRRK